MQSHLGFTIRRTSSSFVAFHADKHTDTQRRTDAAKNNTLFAIIVVYDVSEQPTSLVIRWPLVIY